MKIKKIQKIDFEGKVYNFHCLPDENYFSSNILVHNCYKGNTNKPGRNMSFETFKTIVDKLVPQLGQVAFGITGVQTNPDFIKMMEYCREIGVIPNFTLSGIDLTHEMAKKCASLVGAVAVSAYQKDKNVCYNTVDLFTRLGVKQTNIHLMISEETLDFVYEVLKDYENDARLNKLNAIVFLGLKPKGRGTGFHPLKQEKFTELVEYCLNRNIPMGFDSCSAGKYETAVQGMDWTDEKKKQMISMSESCESTLFSSYINVNGDFYSCSFCENQPGWETGIDVVGCDNFLKDVWYHPRVKSWRKELLNSSCNGCRKCIMYPEINE